MGRRKSRALVTSHGDPVFKYPLPSIESSTCPDKVLPSRYFQRGSNCASLLQAKSELEGEPHTNDLVGISIDNAPVPIFMKDASGTYIYVNSTCAEASGIPRQQILGRTDFDLYPPEIATMHRQNDVLAMREMIAIQREEPLMIGADELRVSVVKFPILRARKEVVGICGISVGLIGIPRAKQPPGPAGSRIDADESFGRLLRSLTSQEARVLNLLAEGLSDSEIAARLTLSTGTVRHHVSHLLKKLRKQSRTQAVVETLRWAASKDP
ncbi:MAG: hypothetical protein QOH90_2094 [Actinomycetota bacterium]|nr:hypothetical protein [Actinomycetota bacterium]